MTCSFCHANAVTEIEEGAQVKLCETHDAWSDEQILRALRHSVVCYDCGKHATEHQHRGGTLHYVCSLCALKYAKDELKELLGE